MVIVKTKGSHGEFSGGLLVAFATSGRLSSYLHGCLLCPDILLVLPSLYAN